MSAALHRLFGEGFRVFFLAAGLFALLAMLLWEIRIGGLAPLRGLAMAPQEWHGHELIFGYGGAALGGFLLTAVPNWTGAKAARRRFIALAAATWLAGRLAVAASGALPAGVVAVVDLGFVVILWAKIATQLARRPKPQNLVFLVFISLFWAANLATHLGWAGLWDDGVQRGLRTGLMALAGMILVIGGRVTPAFTRNAMHRDGAEVGMPRDPALLAPVMIVAATVLPLATLATGSGALAGGIALFTGAAQWVRQARWGIRYAAARPILAALHVSTAMLALGLVLVGLSAFTGLSEIAGLHVLAIGGVGGMTLAVMSRATLGHSGRPLVASGPVALAYVALPLAAVSRWLASSLGGAVYLPATLAAGALWILAFTGFLVALWPAFWGPRADRVAAG